MRTITFSQIQLVNTAEPNPKATPHSIQTDVNQHIMMDVPAILINHSCDPNVGVASCNAVE